MLIGSISHYFFGIAIFITSLFLVLLVLVQRGRGGGIAGALGGAGGHSLFGTKAGDLFTRITVGVASFWILLCCASIFFLKPTVFSTGFTGDKKADKINVTTDAGMGAGSASGSTSTTGSGAFTGEVSRQMLLDVRCKYVILDPSERRQFFGQTDKSVNI